MILGVLVYHAVARSIGRPLMGQHFPQWQRSQVPANREGNASRLWRSVYSGWALFALFILFQAYSWSSLVSVAQRC